MMILIIQPIPFWDKYIIFEVDGHKVVYLFSDFALVLMSLRIFFLVSTIFNYTVYMDCYAKKVCRSYGFASDILFTIKSSLIDKPDMTVFYLFFGTIFISAYIIRILELPYSRACGESTFESFFTALWFTVITITTIGYGDISPGTPPG